MENKEAIIKLANIYFDNGMGIQAAVDKAIEEFKVK